MISALSANCENIYSTVPKNEPISLVDEVVKKFAESYSKDNKTDEESEQEAKNIIDAVDVDKNGSLSFDELNSFDVSTVASEMGANIKDLLSNFKNYDKDGNGELGLTEVKVAIGKKQYSIQELRAMANEQKLKEGGEVTFGGLSDSFFQSIVNNYKNNPAQASTTSFDV